MKKYVKKVLCLVLAVLLFGSMAIPVAAKSGTYEYNEYQLNYTVTRTEAYGMASITTPIRPTTVGAHVTNYVYCEECDCVAIIDSGRNAANLMVPNKGYAYAVAYAYNEFTDNLGTHEGIVQQTKGSFWVGDTMVLRHISAD